MLPLLPATRAGVLHLPPCGLGEHNRWGVLRLYNVASYLSLLGLAPAILLVEEITYYVRQGFPAMVFSSSMPPCPDKLSAPRPHR